MLSLRLCFIALLTACLAAAQGGGTRAAAKEADAPPPNSAEAIKQGHSHYGAAFDTGPRTRPILMKDIGAAPFPITHKNPEVQLWFNQGNTLLHHFWDFEAERAFRWALKLEPENAMVYWGLARAAGGERSKDFIREAARRKNTVSERERLYIEALEALTITDTLRDRDNDYEARHREAMKIYESICVRYPDDLEAKALLALLGMGQSRYGTEQIIREILAKNPNHPGAHHYRIHNWNYHEPEQALESCKRYGQLASASGHALHMPGHVYATVGMWNEAAISMDAATRTEKKNMREWMTFPFNHWNYGHNRAYLSYIQEQLGMADAAIFGARQLIEAPLDPKANGDNPYSSHSQGMTSLLRALVKYERWDDLIKPTTFPWRDIFMDKMYKSYAETRARIGLGQLDKAEKALEQHAALKKDLEKNKNWTDVFDIQALELRARIQFARGNTLEGLSLLSQAAEKQFEQQKGDNDPPKYPEFLYVALGRAYLDAKSPELAAKAFAKSLTLARNDIFALSGLVLAHHAAGERKEAESAMARLEYVAGNADQGLAFLERARATGIKTAPKDSSPGPQRNYAKMSLEQFGPAAWEPFAAPSLNGPTLDEYKGRNVILVFYLGRECLHCMNQLKQINGKNDTWTQADAVVLAVSPNKIEDTNEAAKSAKLDHIRFLADNGHENARRFLAYDDFEDMEIHATILIDKKGRIHWGSIGGDPFTDMDFLEKQLKRMNQ